MQDRAQESELRSPRVSDDRPRAVRRPRLLQLLDVSDGDIETIHRCNARPAASTLIPAMHLELVAQDRCNGVQVVPQSGPAVTQHERRAGTVDPPPHCDAVRQDDRNLAHHAHSV